MNALDTVAGGRLLVVTGKGGVGKSTVAAALATALVDSGRRVLLVEVDPRETLHELLGVPPSDGAPVAVGEGLVLEGVRPRQVIDHEIARRIPIGFLARRVLASPIYHHFVDGAPGLAELAVLEHLRRALEADFDLAVLDGAATGHALDLFRAPRLVADTVHGGPLAEISARLAGLVEDAAATRVVVVTEREEMPVEETFELIERLAAEGGRRPALLIENRCLGDCEREPASGASWELWRQRRALQLAQRERLDRQWRGARLPLEWLALARGPELVRALASRFTLPLPAAEEGE